MVTMNAIVNRARALLDIADVGMAMVYLWLAAEKYAKESKWDLAGINYKELGRCYEMDDGSLEDLHKNLDKLVSEEGLLVS